MNKSAFIEKNDRPANLSQLDTSEKREYYKEKFSGFTVIARKNQAQAASKN
jgi:hypothetical protein